MNNNFTTIFKKGSKTYFYTSLFFPKAIRDDVFVLYAFVRIADNFVDVIPPQKKEFREFVRQYYEACKGKKVKNTVIRAFVSLQKKKSFKQVWVDSFLKTMEQDMTKTVYNSLAQTEIYMYGSAEVIGLMMAAIMNLPIVAYPFAQLLGKSMQYINFIRDIEEDNQLGRTYLPKSELKKYGMKNLSFDEVSKYPSQFNQLIRQQIDIYLEWRQKAEIGLVYIPKSMRVPIKTASDLYYYTAKSIYKNPSIVYKRKVKPSLFIIIVTLIKNCFLVYVFSNYSTI